MERNSGKLGLVEKLTLGVGSAVLSAGLVDTSSLAIGGIGTVQEGVFCAAVGLTAPLIATGIDYIIQKHGKNDTPFLSERYAKVLGVCALGTATAYAALTIAADIYFRYFFHLSFNFGTLF